MFESGLYLSKLDRTNEYRFSDLSDEIITSYSITEPFFIILGKYLMNSGHLSGFDSTNSDQSHVDPRKNYFSSEMLALKYGRIRQETILVSIQIECMKYIH